MPWDEVQGSGATGHSALKIRGLALGADGISGSVREGLARAGLEAEPAADMPHLQRLVRDRKPEFVICAASSLGPDPEGCLDEIRAAKATESLPVFLVADIEALPMEALLATRFSEVIGPAEEPLPAFLLVRAALRRERPIALKDVLRFGRLELDQERHVVTLGDLRAPVNRLERCLLGTMLDAPRIIWTRDMLNRLVFGPADQKRGRLIDTYMSRARRGLRAKIGRDPIVSVHDAGYALSPWELGLDGS